MITSRTTIMILSLLAPLAAQASSLNWGGFVDLRHTTVNLGENPSGESGNPESGFGLEDAAFFGTYNKDKFVLFLDLPFRRQKDSDLDPAATDP